MCFRSNGQNVHSMLFIRTKFETVDYLDKDYFSYNDQLFKISKNLKLDRITDDAKVKQLQGKLEAFKTKNLTVCKDNKLAPDSLLSK